MKNTKTAIAVLLAAAMLLSLLSFGVVAGVGDVNRDGSVDMKDVLMLRKHIAGMLTCDDEEAADLNGDDFLDMKDVLLLRMLIMYGFIPEELPEEPSEVSDEPSEPSEPDLAAITARMLEIVNEARAGAGIAPLTYNDSLQEVVNVRLKEVQELFSHTRPNGEICFTVLGEFGFSYTRVGENIAYGQKTPEEVMAAWLNSEGHRNNILKSDFTTIAIAFDPETRYWVQLFYTP